MIVVHAMLTGITVLDFTILLPGPHASSRLRDLGATVWKIEPPGGDPARWTGPLNDGVGVVFRFHADGKTVRNVDLTSVAGKAWVREMAVDADV
ncbi:MAG: CoA transferase, partial [Sulfobacillus sp.]|nr:CoA transferase [Sulfobacillus sp.]